MEQELERVQEIYTFVVTFLVNYGFQLLGAIIVLLLGLFVARKVGLLLEGVLLKHGIDITLSRFTASGTRITIVAVAVIMALGKVGISVTPFVAAIGAVGLGAGLALQGLLSNYGAGVSIIVARPFVVGDTISVQGVTGVVKEVKLAYTIVSNEDEVSIQIPNKHIVGEIIHNSFADTIVETSIEIAYSSDTELAINLIREAIGGVEGLSERSTPQVGIQDFAARGIAIGMRYWVPTEKLFHVRYAVNAAVFAALKAQGVEIPFPQREVRLLGAANSAQEQRLPS